MSDPAAALPVTVLRRSFELARGLSPASQVKECVHHLTHPEQLAGAVQDAFELMQLSCFDLEVEGDDAKEDPAPDTTATDSETFFWPTRELSVLGDRCSFTCLATDVDPNPSQHEDGASNTGLDYVGLTCDTSSTLVLGAVQAASDATAYPLLLRLFACLTEIAPESQLERMNERHFMGVASSASKFDLNLVLWDRDEVPETSPISELTRDLAEKLKEALLAAESFPDILRDVVCLRMNADRFDGRMRFDWRV